VCVEEVPKPRTELTGIPPAGRAYREAQNESVDPGRPSYSKACISENDVTRFKKLSYSSNSELSTDVIRG
jgi:hypothetical protein